MDYLKLLEYSFCFERDSDKNVGKHHRLEYLSINIFDFTTYDTKIDALFAQKALEVCVAITERNTFEYIENEDNYRWYLIMINMPFFQNKLEYGASIRGAWWHFHETKIFELPSYGFYEDGEQMIDALKFNHHEWPEFILAMRDFVDEGSCKEVKTQKKTESA